MSASRQLLAAAGIQPYTDFERAADTDIRVVTSSMKMRPVCTRTPHGFPRRGKAVKIVAHLLPYLPTGEEYRIVFMHRDLKEVVASQRAMLARLARASDRLDDSVLARTYTGQLVQVQTWLQRRPEIQVLPVSYADALRDPAGTCARLARFPGQPFDESTAATAAEPSLRRQKSPDGIAQAQLEARRRGIDVEVVVDTSNTTARYTAATFLANQGVPVRVNYRYAIMHDKFIVVDGATVETGSFNYTESAGKRNAENVIAGS